MKNSCGKKGQAKRRAWLTSLEIAMNAFECCVCILATTELMSHAALALFWKTTQMETHSPQFNIQGAEMLIHSKVFRILPV